MKNYAHNNNDNFSEIDSLKYNNEMLISIEKNERLKEGYIYYDHNVLISRDIEKKLQLNPIFGKILRISLVEIDMILTEKIDKNYIIEVNIEKDFEFPQWTYSLINIKTPITEPKYIINLWKIIEERIRKKIKSIDIDVEEIKKINNDLSISMEILE